MPTSRLISMSERVVKTLRQEFNDQVWEQVSLAERTMIGVGGKARLYLAPVNMDILSHLLRRLRELSVAVLPLGGGANVVVADGGVTKAAVISLVEHFHEVSEPVASGDRVTFWVESGLRLSSLLQFCRERGYGGLEFLAGIPGSVGGAAVMNAGAFGHEFCDVLLHVVTCDRRGTLQSRTRDQMNCGYRCGGIPVGELVVKLELQLLLEDPEEIAKKLREYRQIRRRKQPCGKPSAGSIFKNPPGDYAGRLLDEGGCRGWRCGGAVVSRKHANFITTEPGATADDVFTLIDRMKARVYSDYSIMLEEEIVRFGDEYITQTAR